MKNKITKRFSIFITNILMLGNILPIFTYGESTTKDSISSNNKEDDGINIGIDETQKQKTTYSNEIENEGLQGSDVYVSQASTFGVIIPKIIILEGKKNEDGINKANYIVTISNESNFAGNEKIKVVPTTNFKLSQLGKNDIEANVTQDKEEWLYNEIDIKGNGEISTTLSAGSWKGTFNFNIELESNSSFIKVEAFDENGNNLNATSSEIKGEKKEQLLNALEESTLINNKNEVDLLIDVKTNEFENMATTTFDVSKIAKENDKVVILHFNETTNEWEYISTETVNSEGKITTNMSSFSPVAFVKVDKNGNVESVGLEAGLYNANNVMLVSWEDSGINNTCSNTRTIIKEKYPLTTKIIIGNEIINIADYAFSSCTDLTNVKMPKSITSIGKSAFNGCTNLKNIEIPNQVTTIGSYAFNNCTSLKNIEVPTTTTTIGEYAFQNVNEITYNGQAHWDRYTVAWGATYMNGYKVFEITKSNASQAGVSLNKSRIIIPETFEYEGEQYKIYSIGTDAFWGYNPSYIEIPNSVITLKHQSFPNLSSTNIETTIIMGKNIKYIGTNAFVNGQSISNITLPDDIVKIENNAFSCAYLDYINYKGIEYTNITELENALKNNGVEITDGNFSSYTLKP